MDCSCPKNFFVFFLLSLLPFSLERRNKLGIAAAAIRCPIRHPECKRDSIIWQQWRTAVVFSSRGHINRMNVYGPPDLRELLVIDEERGVEGWWGVRCHSFDYQELMLHMAQSRPAPPRTNPRWVVQFCRQFWIARRRMFANLKEKRKTPANFFSSALRQSRQSYIENAGVGGLGASFFFFFFFLTWLSRSTINCAHALSTPATYWVKAVYV